MKLLKTYLKRNKIRSKVACNEISDIMIKKGWRKTRMHPTYFNFIVNGNKPPGPRLAVAIDIWSKGAIPKEKLRSDFWG